MMRVGPARTLSPGLRGTCIGNPSQSTQNKLNVQAMCWQVILRPQLYPSLLSADVRRPKPLFLPKVHTCWHRGKYLTN